MSRYIGIDFGGTNIACGLVDEEGRLLVKRSCKTGAQRTTDEILDDLVSLVRSVIKEGDAEGDVSFCGVAVPGTADTDRGTTGFCCNVPGISFLPLGSILSDRLGIEKVMIDNDANCAAKGEAEAGAAKGVKNSVFITLGTGVGGGVVLDGKLFRSFNFAGPELGHTVIVRDGLSCACGRRGCWECYASATALCRMTVEKMQACPTSLMWTLCKGDLKNVSGMTAFRAADMGDAAAQAVLDEFCSYLALGITNMINIFQPEILSVGGGISAEGEKLLAPVRAIVEKEQYSRDCEKKTILKQAVLGNDAGIIGAALLWR